MNKPKKIAIVVANPCNPDYRVIRQAETFAKAGHEVVLFSTKNAKTPHNEVFNGVLYIRERWQPSKDFLRWLTRSYKISKTQYKQRNKNYKYLKSIQSKTVKNK